VVVAAERLELRGAGETLVAAYSDLLQAIPAFNLASAFRRLIVPKIRSVGAGARRPWRLVRSRFCRGLRLEICFDDAHLMSRRTATRNLLSGAHISRENRLARRRFTLNRGRPAAHLPPNARVGEQISSRTQLCDRLRSSSMPRGVLRSVKDLESQLAVVEADSTTLSA
jgi:hypothetical protein